MEKLIKNKFIELLIKFIENSNLKEFIDLNWLKKILFLNTNVILTFDKTTEDRYIFCDFEGNILINMHNCFEINQINSDQFDYEIFLSFFIACSSQKSITQHSVINYIILNEKTGRKYYKYNFLPDTYNVLKSFKNIIPLKILIDTIFINDDVLYNYLNENYDNKGDLLSFLITKIYTLNEEYYESDNESIKDELNDEINDLVKKTVLLGEELSKGKNSKIKKKKTD